MQDPIGAFERIRELYISYLDTAFRIGDPSVAEERRALLRAKGQLCTEPLIEPIPRYEAAAIGFDSILEVDGATDVLTGFDHSARKAFVDLVLAGLFPARPRREADGDWPLDRVPRFKPYAHQVEMLRRGVREGRPGVVTSGTGSGKTESFLLPLIAQIVREAVTWPAVSEEYLSRKWWHDRNGNPYSRENRDGETVISYSAIPRTMKDAVRVGEPERDPETLRPDKANATRNPFQPHRAGEHAGRPAAVRALLLYPMNALVEDQLVRLRKALDSREARQVMDRELKGNRLFFGRYTGATPVTGHQVHPGLRHLLESGAQELRDQPPVYFPDHSAAKEDGRVDVGDLRDAELTRRNRKLEELFDFMVDAEEGQRQARLYAIDRMSLEKLEAELDRKMDGSRDLEAAEFIAAAQESGQFSEDSLSKTFSTRMGRLWNAAERQRLADVVFTEGVDTSCAPSSQGDDAPFLFPSVDGAEQVSRWDMQVHPPDILITNVSMLSAMLNREVDAPIFDKTREWLQRDDAYFYLVLDELHLQRGAAGTEVAYLLRLLLHRLGLTAPEQRHKVRVLASSASLPAAPPEEAAKSADFLWDMFGNFGIGAGLDEEDAKSAWLDAIISGRELPGSYGSTGPGEYPDPAPLLEFLYAGIATAEPDPDLPMAKPSFSPAPESEKFEELWRGVAGALRVQADGSLRECVRECIQDAADRLIWACWESDPSDGDDRGRTRATPISEVAARLFGSRGAEMVYGDQLAAVRAFLFVRGAGDGLQEWLGDWDSVPPSFRVHTFFRNIEGLYAPVWNGAGSPDTASPREAEIGKLSIEREPKLEVMMPGGKRSLRLFELVYCECCGELMVGGLKAALPGKGSGYVAELLPYEPHLDGLPDKSASRRFEDLSWDQYGLFWPKWVSKDQIEQDPDDGGTWIAAALERATGGIKTVGNNPGAKLKESEVRGDDRLVLGRYYDRNKKADRHKRGRAHPGTNVPYACPNCGTSYSLRTDKYRLSPLRNFRAGFGKTTQLLATELFDVQRVTSGEGSAKLVSFSDSRQDAAKGALSIERNHHQDLRRELLVLCLRKAVAARRSTREIREALDEVNARFTQALKADEDAPELQEARKRLLREQKDAAETSIPLDQILERPLTEVLGGENRRVLSFITEHVSKGVHPYDDAGQERPRGIQDGIERSFEWTDLFEVEGDAVFWRDHPARQSAYETARENVVSAVHRALTEVVFSKTYFSLEEAGQGYVTVALSDLPEHARSEERVLQLSGLLRVLADSYRYWPSPYRSDDDGIPKPWVAAGQVNKRVRAYADASWGSDSASELERALVELRACGHEYGVISVPRLRFRLVKGDSNHLRCGYCQRVHLHRGTGVCTRCFKTLDSAHVRSVDLLHTRNFLSRRIRRALEQAGPELQSRGSFRLHCEELTGQTENPAGRQREFKGIFVPEWAEVEDGDGDGDARERVLRRVEKGMRAKAEIDLLTVTTTMEVGIDIGALQVVLQANMPPQRFNYQQRVGRAGRRGQAFSMALTICRTRSHDLYYFRNPKRMTGDIPPTPFLTKKMGEIAQRFLLKGWLTQAFGGLRSAFRSRGELFPGDLMSPPDIHGEFLPAPFLLSAGDTRWGELIGDSLSDTTDAAVRLAAVLAEGSHLAIGRLIDPSAVVDSMERVAAELMNVGLAQALAERGFLPMYGMPTRVRKLYFGLRNKSGKAEWSTVDRDLDLAIYEFAPGSSVVIDKKEHLAVGLTPDLAPPFPARRGQRSQRLKTFQASPYGQRLRMLECGHCHAWMESSRQGGADFEEKCPSCDSYLSPERAHMSWVPNGLRTDFHPKTRQEDADSGIRHRSIQAEGKALEFEVYPVDVGSGSRPRVALAFDGQSRTYRLNRGPEHDDDGGMGFDIRMGTQRIPFNRQTLELSDQGISADPRLERKVKQFDATGKAERIWLAAPKTTDSLFLQPTKNPAGLALHRLPSRTDAPKPSPQTARWLGVRAAALSAAYLLANRASLDLDIDPEEFDVLEPRMYGRGGTQLPLLQITDHLVNGAGFCRNLREESEPGVPSVITMIQSMLGGCRSAEEIIAGVSGNMDSLPYPLNEFLAEGHGSCDTACYLCLLRYGNQPFHGILDWQLGVTFLRALVDPEFNCGLDDDFTFWGIQRWRGTAARLASEMAERFDGDVGEYSGVPAFRVSTGGGSSPWVLVGHPLWEWDDHADLEGETMLARAREEADEHGQPLCWDTFNLARRQVSVREWIRSSQSE